MINQQEYNELYEKYGKVASWTIWSQPTDRPKSNMGRLDVFDDPELLSKINTGFVFVALNGSGVHDGYFDPNKAWNSFHSDNPHGHDYKLRFALNDTPFWGSYITDIIKYFSEVDSGKVVKYLKNNQDIIVKNIEVFKDELRLLGGDSVIVALGDSSYNIITNNMQGNYRICKIKHYSYLMSKEKYREEVLETLSKFL